MSLSFRRSNLALMAIGLLLTTSSALAADDPKDVKVSFADPIPSGTVSSTQLHEVNLSGPISGEALVTLTASPKSIHVRVWAPRSNTSDCHVEARATYRQELADSLAVFMEGVKTTPPIKTTPAAWTRKIAVLAAALYPLDGLGPDPIENAAVSDNVRAAIAELKENAPSPPGDAQVKVAVHYLQTAHAALSRTKAADENNRMRLNDDDGDDMPIRNRVFDLSSADGKVVMPAFQYGITYCLDIATRARDAEAVDRGFKRLVVPWPLNSGASWWSSRYVVLSVGAAGTLGESIKFSSSSKGLSGYDTSATPFLYVGSHVYPWPTDRRIPVSERIATSWQQHAHILIAGAFTDPWPNANTRGALSVLKAAVIGLGGSYWDNVFSFSVGAAIGRGLTRQTDAFGVSRQLGVTLFSPFVSVSTQADVVGFISGLVAKQ